MLWGINPRLMFSRLAKLSLPMIFILLIGIYGAFSAFTIVGPGERGVLVRLGAVQEGVMGEGLHFKIPYVDTIKIVDVTVQKTQVNVDAASNDLQDVYTEVALNYHIAPDQANSVYQTFRSQYKSTLVDPTIDEVVKASTAKFTAEELITERSAVNAEMRTRFQEKLEQYGIVVDQVSIVNFQFSEAFAAAIEDKVTAEQEALASENRLKQAEFDAQRRIAQAKGEAEAIQIQAAAVAAQGGSDYVKLQFIERWNGILPTHMLGQGVDALLGL